MACCIVITLTHKPGNQFKHHVYPVHHKVRPGETEETEETGKRGVPHLEAVSF